MAPFPDRGAWLLLQCLALAACQPPSDAPITALAPAAQRAEPPMPSQPRALHEWLLDDEYRGWTSWPEVHESTFGDGGVRLFFSPTLERSLRAGNTHHPIGTGAVRELYELDLRTRRGVSAMVKVADEGQPTDWLFFEVFATTATTAPATAHRAAPGCVTCHDNGRDFIQSTAEALTHP